jgi:NADH-quinone oxidoreductase subunit C
MDEVLKELAAITGQEEPQKKIDGYWFTATRLDPIAMAKAMLKNQFRLSTASAIERTDGETDIIYHFVKQELAINIRTASKDQKLPSIANVLPSANWIEREIQDQFGVTFEGHPDPRPLNRPNEMPVGFFRKEIAEKVMKEREAK